MLRARIPAIVRPLVARRTFAYTPRTMTDGATGATRPGGQASDDAFSSRRKASEDKWIREEEAAKLKALREKINNAQAHMRELEKYIDQTMKDQGGEQH